MAIGAAWAVMNAFVLVICQTMIDLLAALMTTSLTMITNVRIAIKKMLVGCDIGMELKGSLIFCDDCLGCGDNFDACGCVYFNDGTLSDVDNDKYEVGDLSDIVEIDVDGKKVITTFAEQEERKNECDHGDGVFVCL